MDVREAKLSALIAEGQSFVVDATKVHDGRLMIMNMDGVFGNIPSKVIGCAMHMATLHPTARHPEAKGSAKMVTPVRFALWALTKGSSAKFPSPNHQCIVQHSPHFKIFNQRRGGLIRIEALIFQLGK